MTWDEIAELHNDGFEIGNHTRDHMAVNDKSLRDLPAQIRAINARCKEHGIPQPVSFAYPGNSISKTVLPVLQDLGIKFMRGVVAVRSTPTKRAAGSPMSRGLITRCCSRLLVTHARHGRSTISKSRCHRLDTARLRCCSSTVYPILLTIG